jgi:hypothetical protein
VGVLGVLAQKEVLHETQEVRCFGYMFDNGGIVVPLQRIE